MVHSLKKCGPEKDLPPQVRMKVVGFTGDRGPNQTPTPVIPPSANMWRWKVVEFATDEVAFASLYGAPGNSEKLWAPTTQKIKKKIPRALRFPLALVDWFAKQPRTCHEYYAFLAGQMIRSVDPVSRGDVLFAIELTLAASQHGANDPTSS